MPDRYVYIRHKDHSWIPGLLLKQTDRTARVVVQKYEDQDSISGFFRYTSGASSKQETVTVELKDYPNKQLPFQNDASKGDKGQVEDMTDLAFLHEAAIFYNLKARHQEYLPYTRTGDIVIAMNPYQWFPRLYSEERMEHYSNFLVWNNPTGRDPRKDLPPHVYETSALAFRGMAFDGKHQSILVSGESGAGKTETVKICLNHLASIVHQHPTSEGSSALSAATNVSRSQDEQVVKRIIDSNPLLEAFGNAKTRRNDNSSRFGKYIELQFKRTSRNDSSKFKLAGSRCRVYLLEKSRVVRHDEECERSFHIFYQLLAAPDHVKAQFCDQLKGKSASSFRYLGSANHSTSIEGISDSDRFNQTLDCLATIGIVDKMLNSFMQAVCAVLLLGNLIFDPDPQETDGSIISSSGELEELIKLMAVSDGQSLASSLTHRMVKIKDEKMMVPLSPEAAKDSADALAKHIYECVFLRLVRRINEATTTKIDDRFISFKANSILGTIGLLDIFGFESFPVNSLEQLCINFANERLQAKFTDDVFRSVFEEYKDEGIAVEEITYNDNSNVLDLIQNRTGLLAMLNEECIRPNGSDYGFVNKALHANAESPALIVPKVVLDELDFGIRHYAGDVTYNAAGFVTKNQDRISSDLMVCAQSSGNEIISKELSVDNGFTDKKQSSQPQNGRKRTSAKSRESNLVAPTAWSKYKDQLQLLMDDLQKSRSLYIRCVKPNSMKKPKQVEHSTTVNQLRSSGVVAAVTLARSAFPNRLEHDVILQRFYTLWPKRMAHMSRDKKSKDLESLLKEKKEKCEILLSHALKRHIVDDGREDSDKTMSSFVMGKTRAYFRSGALEYIEASRLRLMKPHAIRIQSAIRRMLATQKVKKIRLDAKLKRMVHANEEALVIQCAWRVSKAKLKHRKRLQNRLAVKIQSIMRMRLAKNEFRKKQTKYLKERVKSLKKERKLKKKNKAATIIQKYFRRKIVMDRFLPVLDKIRERNKLREKVRKLKDKVKEAEKAREQELADLQKDIATETAVKRAWQESVNEAAAEAAKGEVNQVVEYLQAEHDKLQAKRKALETARKPLKKNFGQLMETNETLRKEFADVHQKNEAMKQSNEELIRKRQYTEQRTAQLKQELKNISKEFMPVANGRLDFQMALADIMALLDKKCKDEQLYEDITLLVYECQARAKGLHAGAQASQNALFNSKKQASNQSSVKPLGAAGEESKIADSRSSTMSVVSKSDAHSVPRSKSNKKSSSLSVASEPDTHSVPRSKSNKKSSSLSVASEPDTHSVQSSKSNNSSSSRARRRSSLTIEPTRKKSSKKKNNAPPRRSSMTSVPNGDRGRQLSPRRSPERPDNNLLLHSPTDPESKRATLKSKEYAFVTPVSASKDSISSSDFPSMPPLAVADSIMKKPESNTSKRNNKAKSPKRNNKAKSPKRNNRSKSPKRQNKSKSPKREPSATSSKQDLQKSKKQISSDKPSKQTSTTRPTKQTSTKKPTKQTSTNKPTKKVSTSKPTKKTSTKKVSSKV